MCRPRGRARASATRSPSPAARRPTAGAATSGCAKVVATELPHTWAAWRTGRITEWKATLVARETACLTREDRLAVDDLVCSDPTRLETMGDNELGNTVRAAGERLDAAAHAKRRRKAEVDRHVTLRPAPDTMAYLTALVPVADGVACFAALTAAADTARSQGDDRTKGQVMADTLVASVLDQTAATRADATTWPRETDTEAEDSPGQRVGVKPPVPVSLGITMSDTSVFGTSDAPAHLAGYGPIPAELARELLVDALTREERVWVKRLYTHPTTGELAAMEQKGRFFLNGLARFIQLRDQTCRNAWCDAPVRHTDHAEAHADGGSTTAENGQGLCEACDYAKQAPGWHATPLRDPDDPDGGHLIETVIPTGHRHRTRPPVLTTIRETPIRIDYIRAS